MIIEDSGLSDKIYVAKYDYRDNRRDIKMIQTHKTTRLRGPHNSTVRPSCLLVVLRRQNRE